MFLTAKSATSTVVSNASLVSISQKKGTADNMPEGAPDTTEASVESAPSASVSLKAPVKLLAVTGTPETPARSVCLDFSSSMANAGSRTAWKPRMDSARSATETPG